MLIFPDPFQSFDFGHSRKLTKSVFGVGKSRAGTGVTHRKPKSKNRKGSKKLFYTNTSTEEECQEAFFLTQFNGFHFLKN